MKKPQLTYKNAGVDIEAGDAFVKRITPHAAKTLRKEVLTGIGPFSALFKLDLKKYHSPVLVSGTDGVGTKLKLAFMTGIHDTVGIDLVAMCVNDVLTTSAEPLFFLDYLSVSNLQPEVLEQVIKGIAEGCLQAGCSLIGGETAEMPGFYESGEYDMAGFCVGVVNSDEITDGSVIMPSDSIIGLPSSGIHSNGYSLVRKVFFEIAGLKVDSYVKELGKTIGEELLTPTAIYVKSILELKTTVKIKGMAHITGGGITGNIPRVLPDGYGARIDKSTWQRPAVFDLIKDIGNVPEDEMYSTFNQGIGYVVVTCKEDSAAALKKLNALGHKAFIIGEVVEGERVSYSN
ncbi:MAG: phosphoribosylformylglycinamidine cyclo-ligase [Nitrospirae bacterium]|nr:phosphoribosylformylglycinamidine cyclo-ligase [Nitrospirota bacterium]MBF0521156.1 phosphoribosylformylglycinamidine cyclo-ligase [Nitrospirota bacterium]MBF0535179.1 phosphoribosylformylglycinamidine cyclo-ligase [Nitrospirota bacterium]